MSMPSLEPTGPDPYMTHEDPSAVSQATEGDDAPALGHEPDATVQPEEFGPMAARTGWTLVALIAHDGKEPPSDLKDEVALGAWIAASALWHPSLLARASDLPRIEPVESPSSPGPREIRVVAEGQLERLPSGYRTQAEDAGSVLLESGSDRLALVRKVQEILGAVGTPETSDDPAMIDVALDFLALGTARWMIRDLSIGMGHVDALNHQNLAREALGGADAWQMGDRSTASNRLRAAFEVLTQARERFYPVDAYIADLCLLDPALVAGSLAESLRDNVPISFIAQARAIESLAASDPDGLAALCQGITEGRVDVAGGAYDEAEDLVFPPESVYWQFREGAQVYRTHLDERNVETFARRRFGLSTMLPQIGKRFGFRFALHMAFDGGRFPIRSEAKRLWESPDGTSLETLTRPPLAADRPAHGLILAWRLSATMRNDHVATLPLAHWPNTVSGWYLDLRRTATYSPVLGRWVTLNDYFHLTDRPYETFRPEPDSYLSPYLTQAAGRHDPEPISRIARHHRLRARLEAIETARAFALGIAATASDVGDAPQGEQADPPAGLEDAEKLLETQRHSDASGVLDHEQAAWTADLARRILVKDASTAPVARPGYLVFNTVGVPRRVAVLLPDAALDLRPEGPLRAAQFTDEGVYGVVDLPAFGFAWVPRETNLEVPPAQAGGGALVARGRTLKNETLDVEVDEKSGGLRGVMAVGESTPRLGQQLVLTGLGEAGGKPIVSQMKGERFEVDYAGPALVQATSSGQVVDPSGGRTLARFTQRYRLWTGRPMLEIQIVLDQIDGAWLDQAGRSDPWDRYLACRWAWPDPSSMLRRIVWLSPELTSSERPETPDTFDISTRRQRTALVFGGLPYHKKNGGRMLDTLLVAGEETCRNFTLGVVLDLEHPYQAALDLVTPAFVVPVDDGPPPLGTRGWLAQIDSKAVAITHLGFARSVGEEPGWGLVVHLVETAGQAARCRLRLFRNPSRARQVDFQGETVIELSVDGDGVQLDLTPNEIARVEVKMG